MTSTLTLTAAHTPSLFAAVIAAVMQTFDALHDVHWRAPWTDTDHRWATLR